MSQMTSAFSLFFSLSSLRNPPALFTEPFTDLRPLPPSLHSPSSHLLDFLQPDSDAPPSDSGYEGQHDCLAGKVRLSGVPPSPFRRRNLTPLPSFLFFPSPSLSSPFLFPLSPSPCPSLHPTSYIGANTTVNAQQQEDILEALQIYGADHVGGITVGNECALSSSPFSFVRTADRHTFCRHPWLN
jgi:hypothetical protein